MTIDTIATAGGSQKQRTSTTRSHMPDERGKTSVSANSLSQWHPKLRSQYCFQNGGAESVAKIPKPRTYDRIKLDG